jgi:SET domain
VDRIHLCELGFDRFAVLAPPGCYLNHSCDPNAMRHGVKVFAWRPIAAGHEITIDYRLNAFDGSSWACHCEAKNCTGTVEGSFFAMDPERQALLVPHAPASSVASTGAAAAPDPPAPYRRHKGAATRPSACDDGREPRRSVCEAGAPIGRSVRCQRPEGHVGDGRANGRARGSVGSQIRASSTARSRTA